MQGVTDKDLEAIPVVAQRIADERQQMHERAGNNSRRLYSNNTTENYIGLCGEIAFSRKYDLPINNELLVHGDGGYDFVLDDGSDLNVKTARKPYYLLLKAQEKVADIFVLARFRETGITFLGWEYGPALKQCPTSNFGLGVPSHYKPRTQLHSMRELESRMGRLLF